MSNILKLIEQVKNVLPHLHQKNNIISIGNINITLLPQVIILQDKSIDIIVYYYANVDMYYVVHSTFIFVYYDINNILLYYNNRYYTTSLPYINIGKISFGIQKANYLFLFNNNEILNLGTTNCIFSNISLTSYSKPIKVFIDKTHNTYYTIYPIGNYSTINFKIGNYSLNDFYNNNFNNAILSFDLNKNGNSQITFNSLDASVKNEELIDILIKNNYNNIIVTLKKQENTQDFFNDNKRYILKFKLHNDKYVANKIKLTLNSIYDILSYVATHYIVLIDTLEQQTFY